MRFSGAQKVQQGDKQGGDCPFFVPRLPFRKQDDEEGRSQYLNGGDTEYRCDGQAENPVNACLSGEKEDAHHDDQVQNHLTLVFRLLQGAGAVFDQRQDNISRNTYCQIADLRLYRRAGAGEENEKEHRQEGAGKCHGGGCRHHAPVAIGLVADPAGDLHREGSRRDAGDHYFIVKLFFGHNLVFFYDLLFYNRNEGGTAPKSYKANLQHGRDH